MKNLLIILAGVVLIYSCSGDNTEQSDAGTVVKSQFVALNPDQVKSAGITEAAPVKQNIGLTIYANGKIEVPPQNKTVISAQFGGFVKSLEVLDGMNVRKGQVLLTVEHPELIQLQQDYLEIVGNLEYLKSEMDRQKSLLDKEAGSAKAFQQAKAEYNMATARKSGIKTKLDMAGINMKQLNSGDLQRTVSITSPFDGVVTKVAVNVGAYAEPTEHLLEIIDLKHSHAEVIVFEKDVKHLKIGQQVKLSFGNQEQVLDAEVFLIGKEISKDRTVKVHCHLKTENKDIAPGSYFKASIYTGETERYCVPSDAIVEIDGQSVVFVRAKKEGDKLLFKPVPVNVLMNNAGNTAFEYLDSSRSYDEKVVSKGAYDILSAMLVSSEE